MVVSSLACFVAFVYLLKLVSLEFGEESAKRTLLYLAVYPMSFFLLAVYTESLFLAFTVAAFYHARRGQWTFAGAAAFLAALTRVNGILLVLPIAYEAWQQTGGNLRSLRSLSPCRTRAADRRRGRPTWTTHLDALPPIDRA
jgi:Gpi18-like mannosyltransferase